MKHNRYKLINFRDRLIRARIMYLSTTNPDPYQILFECEFTNEQSNWHAVYDWLYLDSEIMQSQPRVDHMINNSIDNISRMIEEVE